jgi:hypothetical protein
MAAPSKPALCTRSVTLQGDGKTKSADEILWNISDVAAQRVSLCEVPRRCLRDIHRLLIYCYGFWGCTWGCAGRYQDGAGIAARSRR